MRVPAVLAMLPLLLSAEQQPAWVAKSNENAKVLLDILARYSPEQASQLGIRTADEQITIPATDRPERFRRDAGKALEALRSRVAGEQDALVKQDLEILIDAGERQIRASQAYEDHLLPYMNAANTAFSGIQTLLQEHVTAERRAAAVVRLKRYAGLEQGFTPITVLAENVFRDKLRKPGLLGPPQGEVEHDLATMSSYGAGIGQLFEKEKVSGYEEAYGKLKEQISEYEQFVRREVLPHVRTDFRLPPELYAINLDNAGVDYTPAELTRLAHQSFDEIQKQMQTLAVRVAKEHSWPSSDYRDVIKQLKKDQLQASQVMPVYHGTLAQIEAIIRREHLVTLPDWPCIIRQASAAETAQQPAPHYLSPPLIDNHGEQGQFVLPGGTTGPGGKPLEYDDFTFSAASWTLTAHEARPGHDLQFSSMVRGGVSYARAIFAFNSTNVEGWALYAEWFMLPYMPDDGKMISLQLRLLRAARAFLDPELQQGKVTRQQALELLQKDVALSEAFATEEVDRFTYRMPGQAVSYFDGYTRLLDIRSEAQKALGSKFKVQEFHDFILSEGLLPPKVLRHAVMSDFVGRHEVTSVAQ
ncbi:MAG: DUF885 domain-containing protein [Acidobacteriaceae bacterium]|nr:DUF885 domain-containing protein [Acidobacteriaceae bacterium]